MRRNLIIFFVFLVIAFIAGVIISAAFFKVNNITVKNSDENTDASLYYTQEEIIEASGFYAGQNLVLTDVSGAEFKIETTLPYIGEAKIKRKLPDTIEITVTDTKAKYAVLSDSGYVLFDDEVKVLDDSALSVPDTAALVIGVNVSKARKGYKCEFSNYEKSSKLMALGALLNQYSITDVTKINVSSDTDIKFVVSNRITCVLGTMTGADGKVRLASKTIETENQKSMTSDLIIDLSSESKAFVRPDYDKTELMPETEPVSTAASQSDEN